MWSVYIVECRDGSYYTGVSNNVVRRVDQHNASSTVSAKYTRARRPVTLVYCKEIGTRSEAAKREAEIKKLTREEKKILILGE